MSRAQHASDQAADWIIRREDGPWSEEDQHELDAWLAESEGNRAAYLRLRYSWDQADRVGALGDIRNWPAAGNERTSTRRRIPWAVAASLALMVGIGASVYLTESDRRSPELAAVAPASAETFHTAVGGRKIIALNDGSKIELNTASKVRTVVTGTSREVWLEDGEAFFDVVHFDSKPFVVHAGNRTITDLGTKFSVRRDGNKVTVSVLEGRVRVAGNDGTSGPAAIITAGDMAITQGPSTLLAVKSDERVQNALAWRGGMLSFDQSPLPIVAAEFNRYNTKPIVVRGTQAAEMRIGGTFPASHPEAFVRLLHNAYGLQVETNDDAIVVSD